MHTRLYTKFTAGILIGTMMVFGGIQEDCGHGEIRACYKLGVAYSQGNGVKKNMSAAKKYLDLACKNGIREACQKIKELDKNFDDVPIVQTSYTGYGSISYKLMQAICKEKPQLVEGGMPACTCSKVNTIHFDGSESFAFEAVFHGHFTNSMAEEIFIVTTGCEPHTNNWGGVMLFRKNGNRWKNVFYQAGYPGKCKKTDSVNGKSELLCLGEYMNQGYGSDSMVHYAVTDHGLSTIETLYNGENDEGAFDSKGKNTLVKSWKLEDIDQDGHPDVVLFVHHSGNRVNKVTYLCRHGSFVRKK